MTPAEQAADKILGSMKILTGEDGAREFLVGIINQAIDAKTAELQAVVDQCVSVLRDVEGEGCCHRDEYGPPDDCPSCGASLFYRSPHNKDCALKACLEAATAAKEAKT